MPKTLQDLTFTRGTGATRFNEFGNLVGVDFSTTSTTIGTGTQTFTLLATGDRDWSPGQGVIAVAQAGATGSMTGTVTSYSPTTQVLVINVTSITGSGTGTDWRIGSLDLRRTFDPVTGRSLGFLSEAQRTNSIRNSIAAGSVAGTPGTTPTNWQTSLAGGLTRQVVGTGIAGGVHYIDLRLSGTTTNANLALNLYVEALTQIAASRGQTWTHSAWVQMIAGSTAGISQAQLVLAEVSSGAVELSFLSSASFLSTITKFGRRTFTTTAANASIAFLRPAIWLTSTGVGTVIDITLRIGVPQLEFGASVTSPIPTSSVAITRGADNSALVADAFSQSYSAEAGSLALEVTPIDSAVQGVAASINDGSVSNALRVSQRQTGTRGSIRKFATDGVTEVLSMNQSVNNTLRSNGLDYVEVSSGSGQATFGATSPATSVFLTAGASGSIRKSTDAGLTYTARTSGTTNQLNGIAANGNAIVAAGVGGTIIYSADQGETWATATSGTTNTINDVALIAGVFYAPHTAGIQRSADNGVTWTSHTIGGTSFTVNRLASNGTTIVAVGSGGRYSTSTDNGITWSTSALNGVTTQSLNGLFFALGSFVSCGNGGAIITSPNGTTWTLRASGTSQTLYTSMYSTRDLTWYVAGDNGTILRSADTVTWLTIANDVLVGVISSGVIANRIVVGKMTTGARNRVAIAWTAGSGISASLNGVAAVTNASASMPSVSRLTLGASGDLSNSINGAIKSVRLYNKALTSTELTAVSAI